ncbi:BgTH12-02781 [Blumeria graminis f. sp. triticale]|uniref:Bgt-51989 n=2 Tax=Blumeria graminis TaxID=34373 RepID=A0A9X9MIL9_BLUGR|nr:BgTH12-02781 [Blumeria graminis f. sp. triticale]VDB89053.1 Bgt-51989 [Blumeria graminis f. sp. tritici]
MGIKIVVASGKDCANIN